MTPLSPVTLRRLVGPALAAAIVRAEVAADHRLVLMMASWDWLLEGVLMEEQIHARINEQLAPEARVCGLLWAVPGGEP